MNAGRTLVAMAFAKALLLLSLVSTTLGHARLRYRDVMPSYRPAQTRRECHVHRCNKLPADARFAARKCFARRGHLEHMGAQWDMAEVPRVALSNPGEFYLRHIAAAQPVVIAGAAHNVTGGMWSDAFLERMCRLDNEAPWFGRPWRAIVEVNKMIVSNTRHPLEQDLDFCSFIRLYSVPENHDKYYCVSPLTDPGVQLGRHMAMPHVLRCPELHESVHDVRLWMSSGNTSSSLHFDTHENLMLQVEGTKSVYFWPASESHKLYMDYHDRYGLCPVHPDRVDLEHFPIFATLRGGMVANLRAGDALFIPDGWWHQVRTWPGKNVAVTWEFEPYEGLDALWPGGERTFHRFLNADRWSAQVRMKYRNKHMVTTQGGAIACNETVSPSTASDFKCNDNHPTAEFCNFKCLPQTCVTQQLSEKALGYFYLG